MSMSKHLLKLWTSFAKTGVPHPDWTPVNGQDSVNYVNLDTRCKSLPFLFS